MKNVNQTECISIVGNGAIRESPSLGDEERNEIETSLISHESPKISDEELVGSQNSTQRDELHCILRLAVPLCFTYFLELLPNMVCIILVGHFQSEQTREYLDATVLSTMLFSMIAHTTAIGLSSAMDTLCSQAYGAKKYLSMGIYLQSGIISLSIAYIFIVVITLCTEEILIALGQPAQVSNLAEEFTLWSLLGIPFLFLYELLRRILHAHNIAAPMLIIAVVANIINIGLGYLLVYHTNLGWIGASIARSVCNVSLGIILIIYVIISGFKDLFWDGWHLRDAWSGLKTYLSLGIPGLLQVGFEYWAFWIVAIMCGWLPNDTVTIAANYILLNNTSLVYMIYYGVGSAGGTRVGNLLGAGDPTRACWAFQLTLGVNVLLAIVFAILIGCFRGYIPRIYSYDEDIVTLSSSLFIIGAIFQIGDAPQNAMQGVFRGCGRQTLGAILLFVAHYLIGLPLAALLAFPGQLGVHGLWIGMTVGIYTMTILSVSLVMLRFDWDKLSREAIKSENDDSK
mmetsp:Transcript_8154/g.12506  ORF Transcript_8154/g.12506 Transcript_8154/m.12506 type:complete len:513 (+) Transcript_8154:58-1596(+)